MTTTEPTAPARRPIPQPTSLSKPYWDACARGQLTYQKCLSCGHVFFPPEMACIRCQSSELEWQVSSGRGTVYTYTVLHAEPSPGFPLPAALAIIDLAEGYSMFSNIVDCPREQIRIGMEVEVTFERISPDIALPVFRPAAS